MSNSRPKLTSAEERAFRAALIPIAARQLIPNKPKAQINFMSMRGRSNSNSSIYSNAEEVDIENVGFNNRECGLHVETTFQAGPVSKNFGRVGEMPPKKKNNRKSKKTRKTRKRTTMRR